MWRKFCGFLLKLFGWKAMEPTVPEDKCIILGAPHTSIWDFAVAYLYYTSIGGKAYCMIKKEMFWGPLGWILKKMGGLPIDRSKGSKMILSVIKEMKSMDKVHLAIAPEGTRKATKRWKAGFHPIAREVGCPVYLGYFDWKTKQVGRGKKFELTDDAKADLVRLQQEYEKLNLTGKHPEMYITH